MFATHSNLLKLSPTVSPIFSMRKLSHRVVKWHGVMRDSLAPPLLEVSTSLPPSLPPPINKDLGLELPRATSLRVSSEKLASVETEKAVFGKRDF